MKTITLAATLAALASPVLAEGDAAAGEQQFNRQCVACHVVRDDAGEVLAGRNARTGPNLYGIDGRVLAAIEDFRYGDALVALGETSATWDEESFVAYVQNPTAYLREATGDGRARGKMAYQVRDAQQAADIYAFLGTL
ncbi:cytochrome C [Loktanella sp. D2R18]|uniref:c-type cytochrome n=1 Tax=Rhodobacterales TaxID=204455 RepID=UPI000DE90AE4|nr:MULTISPECIES: c-type cytochrome [Rhodobacterales]MDO6590489.1 c-type cytochrome [Yoonia sp. 1_MG-2023]RBW41207.1 cytochrome C [Loktanella sp. D2R18]